MCFALHTSGKHHEISDACEGTVFADTCFFLFLKKRKILQATDPSIRRPGDLVVYVNHGLPLHIGIAVAEERVVAKWGTGLLLEHGIMEIPASYGSTVEAYEPPDYPAIEKLFVEYGRFIGGAA